ncbi:MAG TPA: hypothetical protein VK648_07700 [Gemmatimonadaceae bacterium]|nr:hypothetical protein [Gemmatimonadaceae bacterium]
MAPVLPRVLAGPILRRAEPTGVWIWFAFRLEPVAFHPNVLPFYPDGDVSAEYGSGSGFPLAVPTSDDLRTIHIAKNVWISLLRIRPSKGDKFPTDLFLGYTAQLALKGEQTFWLHDEIPDIAYRPFSLPTFFLSSKPRRIAQASCRRPGAEGYDAHLAFDSFMTETISKFEERPYALFLTGDQIYADDVAEALFDATAELARDVFGYHEEILAGNKAIRTDALTFGKKRKAFVKSLGFTTQDGEGHLLSISEFAAMYLLVWGPGVYKAYNPEGRPDILKTHQGPNLVGFGPSVDAARRVLANIPTYMMFDDHEVTDDWNFDGDWVRATNRDDSNLILSNALFVYWVFQAWGNDPDGLEWMRTSLASQLEARHIIQGKYHRLYLKGSKWILGNHPWSYVAPLTPQTLVVNCRTQRQFPNKVISAGKQLRQGLPAAVLVGKGEIARIKRLVAGLRRGEILVLVVATPLFMLPFVGLAAMLNEALGGVTRLADDHELFVDNTAARDYFLAQVQTMLKFDSIVAFAGDVHHSFMMQGKIDIIREVGQEVIDVLQITSSPIKNMHSAFKGAKGFAADLAEERDYLPMEIDDLLGSGITWDVSIDGQGLSIAEAEPLSLKGKLGHSTHIPNNNFCVVDFRRAPGAVDVIYVGMDGKTVAKASCSVALKPATLP